MNRGDLQGAQDTRAAAALVSGGLDSAVMLAELVLEADTVFPLYVRTGLRWEEAELHWIRRLLTTEVMRPCAPLSVLELPVEDIYGDHWSLTGRDVPGYDTSLDSNYLPGRNLLLLSKAAVFCAMRGVPRIALAPLSANPFPDGTLEFFRAAEEAIDRGLAFRVKIELPFRSMAKAEVIQRGRHLPLELTFSCIQPVGIEHCGDCTKCAERQHGFAAAHIPDPTPYRRILRKLSRED